MSGTPPGDDNVGQIILRDLARVYPAGHLSCFATPGIRHEYKPADGLERLPVKCVPRRYEIAYRPGSSKVASIAALMYVQVLFRRQVDLLVKAACAWAEDQDPDRLWVVLDSVTTIAMSPVLKQALGLPMITLVWDPPEYLARRAGFDRYSRRWLLKRFARALKMSERTAVVSENMRDDYSKLYGANTIILRHAVKRPLVQHRPMQSRFNKSNWYLGFSGSLYSKQAWNALMTTLDELNWQLDGKRVIVKVLGADVRFRTQKNAYIEYLGWRSTEETVTILSDCDANYLPYPFEKQMSDVAHYAFPSKLGTYIAAGRPIFMHAPEQSSIVRFHKKHPVGKCCTSLEKDDVTICLHSLADDNCRKRAESEIMQVAKNVLSYGSCLNQFADFVDIDRKKLADRALGPVKTAFA